MVQIDSPQNAVFKSLLELTKSKGVKDQSRALVSGEKITHEISRLNQACFWICTKDQLPSGDNSRTVVLAPELFKKLDVCGTHKPLLCAEFSPIKDLSDLDQTLATLYVALSDPNNLGALIRTCAAFEWPQIVLLQEAAHPFLPRSIRAASGTCFATVFFKGPSINDLKDPTLFALDRGGRILKSQDLKKNMKLLVGEEGQGVPSHFVGQKLQIPISNKVESLNATIATSLVIYDWSRI